MKYIYLIVLLSISFNSFSQAITKEDFIKLIKKTTSDSIQCNSNIKKIESDLNLMKSKFNLLVKDSLTSHKELSALKKEVEEFKKNKLATENEKLQLQVTQLTEKNAALNLVNEKNNKIITEKDIQIRENALKDKEIGKKEVISAIINGYKNKKFDDIINNSSKESILRDKQLIGVNSEVANILTDLEIYFKGKDFLSKKIDLGQLTIIQAELNRIKQPSTLLIDIKEKVENYSLLSIKLKETIENVSVYDDKTSSKYMIGNGMPKETKQEKLNSIFSVLIPYISDYELKYNDYPYLFDIVIDIIKRKQSNTDDNITDLIKKLQ